jgi:hypothetical protein
MDERGKCQQECKEVFFEKGDDGHNLLYPKKRSLKRLSLVF